MKVRFDHNVPIEDTMMFEDIFEENLKYETVEEKGEETGSFIRCYMFVDDKIVGEIYAADVDQLFIDDPNFVDIEKYVSERAAYLHSTAILPEYQHKGYGKILKTYFHGYLKGSGYDILIGHSTAPAINDINDMFGVTWLTEHENWYDTGKIAKFYELYL